jgi:hypothetical protein
MNKYISVLAAFAVIAAGAQAQVVPGSFTPEAIEDYEGTGGERNFLTSIFDGAVGVAPSFDNHASVDAGDWYDFRTGSPIVPTSGSIFGTIYGFGGFTLDFTGLGGVAAFGGWGSDAATGATSFEFFDMGGSPIGVYSYTLGPGDGTMDHFSFTSSVAIGSVRLSGPETAFDDLAYSTIPAPGAACLLAGAGLLASRRRRA